MALTNYRAYKWLIFLLDDAPDQKFGMSLEAINKAYEQDYYDIYNVDIDTSARVREGIHKKKKVFYKGENGETTLPYKTLINWRNAIWKEFGLIVWHPVIKKKVNKIINGVKKEVEKETVANTYILQNPELLDEDRKLRDVLIHLAEDEQRGYVTKSPFTATNRGRKPKVESASTVGNGMGFVSVGNSDVDYYNPNFGYQEAEVPEMVGIIQFVMTVGEALVIKYSKLSTPAHKEQKFILEPQQLKQINSRWYVAGNLYEYGNRDTSKLVVYDVDRIRLCEDVDVEVPTYTIKDDFDIYNLLPADWTDHFNPDKVVSLYLKTAGRFLDETPFCSAQEKVDLNVGMLHNLYKVYEKPDADFYIQYMAYGDELKVTDLSDKVEAAPTDISPVQIKYLRDLRKQIVTLCS